MRGSTRKRGATWTAIWDAGTDPTTGKRKQGSRGGFRTRRLAEAFLDDTLPKVRAGVYVEPSTEPLRAYLARWLDAVDDEIKPGTLARYRQLVAQYITPREIGSVPLAGLTPAHFTRLYSDLEQCSDASCKLESHDGCRGLAPGTRRLLHACVRRALNDAVRHEDGLTRNPAARVKAPRIDSTRVMAWSPEELSRFLAHVEHDRLYALWRLAATTGMRRGELLGLQWQTVDLDAATLRVERQLHPAGVGPRFGTPKSKRGLRQIALDAGTVEALRKHRERQMVEQALAGDLYEHEQDLVFCNEIGQPIRPEWLTREFPKLRKAAGIPVGSLHVLRHTAVTIALTRGVPVHIVAARAGDHPATILATYAHLLPHSDVTAADAIAAAIGS